MYWWKQENIKRKSYSVGKGSDEGETNKNDFLHYLGPTLLSEKSQNQSQLPDTSSSRFTSLLSSCRMKDPDSIFFQWALEFMLQHDLLTLF